MGSRDNKTPTRATKATRQAKRSSAFMHMDVMNCCDEVDHYAEEYAEPDNFIRAVILELEKLNK